MKNIKMVDLVVRFAKKRKQEKTDEDMQLSKDFYDGKISIKEFEAGVCKHFKIDINDVDFGSDDVEEEPTNGLDIIISILEKELISIFDSLPDTPEKLEIIRKRESGEISFDEFALIGHDYVNREEKNVH